MAKGDKELLKRIRERYKLMVEADGDNRRKAIEDFKFLHIPGEQWDPVAKKERGNRPCYEFNKTAIKAKRIVNEMRANRPAGKVRATKDSTKKTADVIEGLCRNIWNVSDGDTICDYAGEYQVGAGMGAWRVVTEYTEDDSFEQDIRVKPIKNPFCLWADPAASDPLKRDAEDWILEDRIPNSIFEQKYKNAQKTGFDASEFADGEEWEDEHTTRVVEYWWKEPYDKELWQLDTGETIDAESDEAALIEPARVKRKRVSKCHRIMMCIASGEAILEGPTEQAGRNHRFIMVHGEWKVVDGQIVWHGIVRNAKDAQRSYNVSRTAVTETIATAPNSHFWATHEQAKGNTELWARAHKEALPFLLYNSDPKAPGSPARMGGPDVPVALIQEMQMADQELKDVTGVYDASLGERSNEKSGVAISRREQQTQIVNFNYPDNMAKGVQRTWEIIVDLAPEIYDTERIVRVLGVDGAEDYVKVNTVGMGPDGQPVLINDLTRGKYDVTVTVGPSYATQRQEAAESYGQLAQSDPMLMATAADLVYGALDLPYSKEISERRRAMLPPPIQQMIGKGKDVPPEVAQAMAQVNQLSEQITAQGQLVQQAAAEADKAKTEAEKAVADLKVQRAQFDADVDKARADIATREAALILKQAQATAQASEQEGSALSQNLQLEVKNAITGIQQLAAQYLQEATQSLAQIHASSQPQVIVSPSPPRPRVKHIERQNGRLVPVYEDQMPMQNGMMQ